MFEIIGNLYIGKKSEKFNPYEINTFKSGWVSRTLKMKCFAGENRHSFEIKGGCFDNENFQIYTFAKSSKAQNGENIKGTQLKINWQNRFNEDEVNKVAEFKKFIVDIEKPGLRGKIQKIITEFEDKNIDETDLKNNGFENIDQAKETLKNSKAKRKEFVSEYDFADFVYKLINSNKFNNKKFKIRGNVKFSEYKGKFYTSLCPTQIFLAEEEALPKSEANLTIFYNKDCLDATSEEQEGKYYINAFTLDYDSNLKKKRAFPIKLSVPIEGEERIKKFSKILKNQLKIPSDENIWKELGLKISIIDSVQKIPITKDMLSDTERDLVEAGILTFDEVLGEHGNFMYGDKYQENLVTCFARGYYSGAKPTVLDDQDFRLNFDDFQKDVLDSLNI